MLDFLDICDADFVRDGVTEDFDFDSLDSVSQKFVAVLGVSFLYYDGVVAPVGVFVLRDVDAIVLHIINV